MDATQWHLFFSARKPFEPLFRKVESINTCKQDNHARARAHIWEQRCTQCKVVLVTGKWSWSRCLCWCALLKDSCNGTVFIELYPHNWSFFLFFLEDWYDTYTKAGNLHHLVYSLYFVSHQSHCDTFRGVSEPGEEDVTIPSRALDSRANSIGLTPPRSCGTCPQAFLTTARVSACPVLSGGARALSTSPPQSLTRITSEEQSWLPGPASSQEDSSRECVATEQHVPGVDTGKAHRWLDGGAAHHGDSRADWAGRTGVGLLLDSAVRDLFPRRSGSR